MDKIAIVWLRRDLRLEDHFAFHKAKALGASVVPIFIFDEDILQNLSNKNDKRISFIIARLKYLNEKLKSKKAQIYFFKGKPKEVIKSMISEFIPDYLIASSGYEKYDIERDKTIAKFCEENKIEFICENDHLIFSPDTIKNKNDEMYKVYTPFSKSLYRKIKDSSFETLNCSDLRFSTREFKSKFCIKTNDKDEIHKVLGFNNMSYDPWESSFENKDIHPSFYKKVSDYHKNRDFLDIDGTSRFSPYLRFGFISIRACINFALEQDNSFSWINELMWRDFYATCLFHYPEFYNQEFQAKYRNLKWQNDDSHIDKFKNSKTGYPIVDAAMSQLTSTGWMHNRARMIVASFFTKHLLCDWRIGEKIFAEFLLDYELSSNVGSWQWAASTGFDAQPYFRVFNPYLQSSKFDPEGNYIRKYIPSMHNIETAKLHSPSGIKGYYNPVVEHSRARQLAIQLYKSC